MGIVYLKGQGGSSKLPLTETTEYELLADIEVTGSATTNVYINGLSIGKGDEVVLVSTVDSTSASSYCLIYYNNNVVNSNYYTQYLDAENTVYSGGRSNLPQFDGNTAGKKHSNAKIKLTNNGYIVHQIEHNMLFGGSSLKLFNFYGTTTWTASAITSIQITASATNGIGIGSRFQLYRATGEVTQTWATV